MRDVRPFRLLGALAIGGMLAAAPAHAEGETIAFSIPSLGFPFFVHMQNQFNDEAKALGVTVKNYDGQNQTTKQTADVEAAITSGVNTAYFYNGVTHAVTLADLTGGLAKSVFFGLSITLIACHHGLSARGGTAGVGRATTRTVVVASIVTLVSDFVLTEILLAVGL